jgi:hypothetical protein
MREWNVKPQRASDEQAVPETPRRPKALAAAPPQKLVKRATSPAGDRTTSSPASKAVNRPAPKTTAPLPTGRRAAAPAGDSRPAGAEQQLADLIEAYKTGTITRAQYARDKQLLLAKISPETVKLRRAVKAPVRQEVEPKFGLTRRFLCS